MTKKRNGTPADLLKVVGQLQALEDSLHALLEHAHDTFYCLDAEGRFAYVSSNWNNLLGHEPEQVIGEHFALIVHPDDMPACTAFFADLAGGRTTGGEIEYRVRHGDGGWRWHVTHASRLAGQDGAFAGMLGLGQDQTERYRAREALHTSERRHRLLAESANDVIWTMTPAGRITFVSNSVERMRGLSPEEAMRQPLQEILTPSSQALVLDYLRRLQADIAAGKPPQGFRGDVEYYCRDGSVLWTEVRVMPLLDDGGRVLELLGVTRDLSERKRYEEELKRAHAETQAANEALRAANEELRRMATTDGLTGLANRRHFEHRAQAEIERVRRYGGTTSVIIIDIDHFKRINDIHGHLAGDAVLADLAARIRGATRTTDLPARWGGEDFVVLLPQADMAGARQVAEKLRARIAAAPFPGIGTVTVSLGAAERGRGEGLDPWLMRADAALYAAKAAGRDRVVLAKPAAAMAAPMGAGNGLAAG